MKLDEQLNRMKKLMGIDENLIFEKMSNDDIHAKYYSKIPKEDFEKIVDSDPTKKKDGSIGKYTKWLLNLYQKNNLRLEDLYKATDYLGLYTKYFNHVQKKDINQFSSLADLYKEVEKFKDNSDDFQSNSEKENEIKKDAEKVYEDANWLVIVPKTKEASCYYGKGTQWCTAASDNNYEYNMFDSYNRTGRLYINIDKKNNRKYQFHFSEYQFMDEQDNAIDTPIDSTIGMTQGLLDFYRTKVHHLADTIFDLGEDAKYSIQTDKMGKTIDKENRVLYDTNGNIIAKNIIGFDLSTNEFTVYATTDGQYIVFYSDGSKEEIDVYDTVHLDDDVDLYIYMSFNKEINALYSKDKHFKNIKYIGGGNKKFPVIEKDGMYYDYRLEYMFDTKGMLEGSVKMEFFNPYSPSDKEIAFTNGVNTIMYFQETGNAARIANGYVDDIEFFKYYFFNRRTNELFSLRTNELIVQVPENEYLFKLKMIPQATLLITVGENDILNKVYIINSFKVTDIKDLTSFNIPSNNYVEVYMGGILRYRTEDGEKDIALI